jgi:hypothetical protein
VARARLLQLLDSAWGKWSEQYRPTPVEAYLEQELGVGRETVMLAAVQIPDLCQYDVDKQVRPAVRAMKAAGIDSQSIWFTVTRPSSTYLLAIPTELSRWLDFLGAYGVDKPRDMQNFLLRVPRSMLEQMTL